MDLSKPIADAIPGHRGTIIAALVHLRKPVTGRELAKHSGVPAATTQRIINDLADAGIVTQRPSGRSVEVALNRAHLIVSALEQLVQVRSSLVRQLQLHIAGWSRPAAAVWLFGSAARGDGDRKSDIDIVVVARAKPSVEWEQQINALAQFTFEITGNTAQILEYQTPKFRAFVKSANPLTQSLRADGIELVKDSALALKYSK